MTSSRPTVVLLFLGAWALRWRDRWLVLTALVFFVLTSLPSDNHPDNQP